MHQLRVVMLYIEPLKQWYMFSAATGGHLQEFHDCANVRECFKDLDEHARNEYTITIEKANKGGCSCDG